VLVSFFSGRIDFIDKEGALKEVKGKGRHIHYMESFANGPNLIVSSGDGNYMYNVEERVEVCRLQTASIKDLQQVSPTDYLLSFSNGAAVYQLPGEKSSFKNPAFQGGIFQRVTKNLARIYAGHYDSVAGQFYLGNPTGLFLTSGVGKEVEKLFKGRSLSVSDIDQHEGRMYIATEKWGILVMQGGEFIDSITPLNGLSNRAIRKMKFHQGRLYISHSGAFQVWDLNTRQMITIGPSEGLNAKLIVDFAIAANRLWLVTQKGLQVIELSSIKKAGEKPLLKFSSFLVNGKEPIQGENFDHEQNSFQFEVKAMVFQDQSEIQYKYWLVGAENDWQYNPFLENKIEYKSLSPGDYAMIVIPMYQDLEGEGVRYRFTIDPPWWGSWWFYTAAAIGLVLLSFATYRIMVKRQLRKMQIQNELNASKLTAIQSQMNPHFIFNALNSIQDLVLKGDIENSYSYITKFASLVRSTLSYSDRDFIEFEQELKLIELYLTLEKLRFKADFEYEILSEEIEGVRVPPMLIQPFIENALVHGLLHKEGLRRLTISFELKETLICTISDNGIGRSKAKEIRKRQRGDHESFSVNAIRNRLAILEEHFGGGLGFKYHDLEDQGEVVSTQVIVRLPVSRSL